MIEQKLSGLSDETQRAMVISLMQGELSAGQLAEPFAMTLTGVMKRI